MFVKGTLANKLITDDCEFSLKGMVEPTFYNFGDGNVKIDQAKVEPEVSFSAGATGVIMQNTVSIKFEEGARKELRCFYVSIEQQC
tara:strand:- start:188 stop:445 length:258 start_codon:yes stop_codon:yes gene_type:complete